MREEIVNILYRYKSEHVYLNIALNELFNQKKFSKEDKDLITRIVYGTIQNEIYIEYQMKPYIKKKLKPYDEMVVKMSFYQIIFLDKIPHYAIINEAVNIVKKKNKVRSQVVNAILRNFIKNGVQEVAKEPYLEYLSIQYSMPLWLVKMLSKQYKDDYVDIIKANLDIPNLTARINTLKGEVNIEGTTKGNLSEYALIFKHGNIAHTKEYQEGKITIQDESSQMVAPLLNPSMNSTVLDMCAAPGGKSAHLASIMNNTGIIHAFDLYEHKVKLINSNLERLGVTNVVARAYDSTRLDELFDHEYFDHILLDAPCSGFGVISRKPEIKYQPSTNMDEIIQIQAKLLEKAYILLKKGGTMVYSTCTLNKKENMLQIEKFLNSHKDMKLIKERTILPHEYHSDGFFMCKLEKIYETDI